jgi:hypothetical protein
VGGGGEGEGGFSPVIASCRNFDNISFSSQAEVLYNVTGIRVVLLTLCLMLRKTFYRVTKIDILRSNGDFSRIFSIFHLKLEQRRCDGGGGQLPVLR